MGDQNKVVARPIFRRDVTWEPFPNWTQTDRIFNQDFGLPPFLDSSDVRWIEWAQSRLASIPWPAYAKSPVLSGLPTAVSSQGASGGVSEVRTSEDSWKINLDVNHFSPEEITITTKDGYLEISGNHEEKQDEHGSVARCFTKKYKLPQGVDLQQVKSTLSGDGVLCVEAPIPGTITDDLPGELVIPVQTTQQQVEDNE